MTILLGYPGASVLSGAVETAIRQAGREILVFSDRPTFPEAPWKEIRADALGLTVARRSLEREFSGTEPLVGLGVGIPGVLRLKKVLNGAPIVGIIARGELDFSSRRKSRVEAFTEAAGSVCAFIFESDSDMLKAVAHGSRVPHLLMPLVDPGSKLLSSGLSARVLVVVVPDGFSAAGESEVVDGLRMAGMPSDVEVRFVTDGALFSDIDVKMGRSFGGTVRLRAGADCEAALFLGDGPGCSVLIAAFAASGAERVFVEGTLGNEEVAFRLGLPDENIARGQALYERVALYFSRSAGDAGSASPASLVTFDEFCEFLEDLPSRSLPWWYEEGIRSGSSGSIAVFSTVAGIEDRRDGARPQRIRNVYGTLRRRSDVVTITSNSNVIARRGAAIRARLLAGEQADIWYGENSTTPMLDSARVQMFSLIEDFRAAGGRSAWFVRDLHWLSGEATYDNAIQRELRDVRRRGIRELKAASRNCDVMFVPSFTSGREFDRLLSAAQVDMRFDWIELPPALSDMNVVREYMGSASGEILELVYSGGYGGIYNLNSLWEALSTLNRPWRISLVTRPDDRETLERDLRRWSIDVTKHVRWVSSSFSDYSVSSDAVAILLLDSDYGKASFPYKTVSYAEKGLRVLTYEGTDPASFLGDLGLALTVRPDVDSLRDLLASLPARNTTFDDGGVRRSSQLWSARMEFAIDTIACGL